MSRDQNGKMEGMPFQAERMIGTKTLRHEWSWSIPESESWMREAESRKQFNVELVDNWIWILLTPLRSQWRIWGRVPNFLISDMCFQKISLLWEEPQRGNKGSWQKYGEVHVWGERLGKQGFLAVLPKCFYIMKNKQEMTTSVCHLKVNGQLFIAPGSAL